MPILQKRVHSWAVGWLGWAAVSAAAATWRISVIDPRGVAGGIRDGSGPVVATFWHCNILPLLTKFRGCRVCVPVSEHQDGEYVAQVMHRFGLESVRGSTTRGAVKLLRGMTTMMDEGWTAAVTPDGPRGPRFSIQPGFAFLARRSGLPVCPVGVAVRDAWTVSSWDRFVIPRPWTRIVIAFGELLHAGDYDDVPAFCEALARAMSVATETARNALEEAP